jgi:hypothetical protein
LEQEFWQQAMDTPAEERIRNYAANYNAGITGQFMNERNVSRAATDQFVKDRGTPIYLDALRRAMDIKYGPAANPIRRALGGRPSYTPGLYGADDAPAQDEARQEEIKDLKSRLAELEGR